MKIIKSTKRDKVSYFEETHVTLRHAKLAIKCLKSIIMYQSEERFTGK